MTSGGQDAAPLRYRGYDQAGLDRAYDQAAWSARMAEIIAWYRAESDQAYRHLPFQTHSYGPSGSETFDLFPASARERATLVYVHGGAWRLLSKRDSAFAAPLFHRHDINFIALDFGVIPQVRLPQMVQQVGRAIAWIARNAEELGIAREEIHLCGHSSGAHLAAMAAIADWRGLGLGSMPLASVLCASGCYDLEPVMLSARGAYLLLSSDEQHALSPLHYATCAANRMTIAYGDRESPEFIRQGQAFHRAIYAAGRRPHCIIAPGLDHFEISMTLASADGILASALLAAIYGRAGPA